jgi:hypothetical protein
LFIGESRACWEHDSVSRLRVTNNVNGTTIFWARERSWSDAGFHRTHVQNVMIRNA